VYCYGKPFGKRFCVEWAMAEMKFKHGREWFLKLIKNMGVYLEYKRYRDNFKNFIPTFRPSVLAQKLPDKPTMIFFSMSDPAYWKQGWYEKILEKICYYMQHTFVILTKSPEVYLNYTFPHNCWLGVTCVNQEKFNQFEALLCNYLEVPNKLFVSIEPINGPVKISGFMKRQLDWVIVGPETGKRENKIIPQPEWIESFFDLPGRVFMKSSCSKIIDRPLRQEWPEGYLNG
jgi:hypothetical protein